MCWLKLREYHNAVSDADHTLCLMDFCGKHSPDDDWTHSHEQYRPFVLFQRTQAAALSALEQHGPEEAVQEIGVIRDGLGTIPSLGRILWVREFFVDLLFEGRERALLRL